MRLVTERLRQIDLQAGGTATGGLPKHTVEVPRESILVGGILQIEAQAYRIKRTFDVGVAAVFQPRLGARYLAVKVDGDSMTGSDINDNDYVIVREQPRVETGEIAVVLVDDPSGVEDPSGGTSEVRSTVKRFYQQGNRVLLRASNPDFNPQEQPFQAAMIRVLGRVVAVACPKTS
jgi:SOS-response transcriptional repressor LexA